MTGARWWWQCSPIWLPDTDVWQRWWTGLRLWQPLLTTEPGPLDAEDQP